MNLYHIEAPTSGYDVYSDAVVAAETADEARRTHPGDDGQFHWYSEWPDEPQGPRRWNIAANSWVRTAEEVTATQIGVALNGLPAGVVCASFHAG